MPKVAQQRVRHKETKTLNPLLSGLNTALPCFGSLQCVVKGSLHMALIYEAVFKGLTCQVKFVDSHSHA